MRKLHAAALGAAALAMGVVSGEARAQSADDVVRELYDLVTFEAGTTPDWDRVRSLFLDEAVIVLRTTRTANEIMSLDGFIGDWLEFIERAKVTETGFEEQIIRTVPLEFKDIAHVLVLYEAHIPGSPRPPQQGVDSFSLVRRDGQWRIAAVLNDVPDPQHPVPAVLEQTP